MAGIYDQGLGKNAANHVALSPLSFLARSAEIYPHRLSVVHGERRLTWADTYQRCRRLASALVARGVGTGDTVAVMAPNLPEMFDAHFAVAMAGAVLNAINVRLDATAVAFILQHSEAKVVLVEAEFSEVMAEALAQLAEPPLVVDIVDPTWTEGRQIGELTYDALLAQGDPDFSWQLPADEWDAITLNYTSGTTGDPKGVVYHHRGAYLNAVSNALTWEMGNHAVYLWTLPMFHCNGWCFPWTLAATASVSVCLRHVRADQIFELIRQENVSHFCGAPIVLNTMLQAPDEQKQGIPAGVRVMTAGAPPPAAVIQGMEALGFDVTHVYGLTETYGPVTLCAWQGDLWDAESADEQAVLKSRQGVRGHMLEGVMVADPETMVPVPKDGSTMGEIMMRGNNVMKGYLKNPATTEASLVGGWFHSGDLAVWHDDGYIKIRDRSKDIIISGGENISSIEVEDALFRHPAILEAAVVAQDDDKWGEVPCAFVTVKPGAAGDALDAAAVQDWCRSHLARFKVPKRVVFGALPKTSTGKVQKFVLRDQANGSQD